MRDESEIIVFLGPTMLLSEAKELLHATFLPPAKQSDILSVVRLFNPKIICLIDGEFGQSLSVWHKEILYAMNAGVKIYGAASMGALRAAETHHFGMIGVGQVYEMYKSGELSDDDEVALTYAPRELNYCNLSVPMVNIRATLNAAVESGSLDSKLAVKLADIGKALHFPDRTVQAICDVAELNPSQTTLVNQIFGDAYVDIKRGDAIELLRKVRQDAFHIEEQKNCPEVLNETLCFLTQFQQDRWDLVEGIQVTQRDICKHIALHHKNFDSIRDRALHKALLLMFAKIIGVELSADEATREGEIWRQENKITTEKEFADWRRANDATSAEYDVLMRDRAIIRKLEKWYITKQSGREITQITLDELRASGEYPFWAKAAANKHSVVGVSPVLPESQEYSTLSLLDLIAEQHLNEQWPIPTDIFEWIELSGFNDATELRQELFLNWLCRNKLEKLAKKISSSW